MSKYPVDVEVKTKSIQRPIFDESANSTKAEKFRYSCMVNLREVGKSTTGNNNQVSA